MRKSSRATGGTVLWFDEAGDKWRRRAMPTGIVKSYNSDKGFGFIRPDSGGGDVFVHISRCAEGLDELVQGQRVRFDEQQSRKKPGQFEAVNVALL
jgi:CspA family cold shock protein